MLYGPGRWRRVCGTHPGSWESCLRNNNGSDPSTSSASSSAPCLRLCGPLTGKLTDERVERLLSLAGPNMRSFVVNDAALAFTGKGCFDSYARLAIAAQVGSGSVGSTTTSGALELNVSVNNREVAPTLRTLDLRRCPGVTGKRVIQFLSLLRIDRAAKEDRLAGGGLVYHCSTFPAQVEYL